MRDPGRRMLPLLGALLLVAPAWAFAQNPVTINGRVTSDAQAPLPYAEISIPALGVGAVTRDDGHYAIFIPAARVSGQSVQMTVRRLGYKAQTVTIDLTQALVTKDFTLAPNPLQLGEIVATGAGTVSAPEKLGNSRNAVTAEAIDKSNESNIVEALAAKAPNVQVTGQSGDPGASSFIQIRGIRTVVGNNQPLFVVDGVPINNSATSTSSFNPVDGGYSGEGTVVSNRAIDLNPNDIENVEILKGAAAGAIYGARAGQGVVMITTKSGRAGATHFSFRSTGSFDNVNHYFPLQTSYGQGSLNIHADTSLGGTCDDPGAGICRRSWGPAIPAGAPVYDHSREIYTTGHVVENAMTISGGNDRTTFYLSGENLDNNGFFVGDNDRFNRTTVRVKASHRPMDALRLNANFAFTDSRGSFTQRGNNINAVQIPVLRTPPDFNNLPYLDPVNGLHRSYRFQHPQATDLVADRGFDNPFFVIYQQKNLGKVGRVFGNVGAEYLATPWLKFDYALGADYTNDERLEGCPMSSSDVCFGGRVIEGKIVNYQIDHNLTGTANYTLNSRMSGTVTLGQNLNSQNIRNLFEVGRTLVAPSPFKLSNTVSRDNPIDNETVIHRESYFGQATLDMYDQLYLTASLRNDGFSNFGRLSRRAWFPKASAAWTFTKVIGERPWLSYGKLRLAYGQAGTEPPPYVTSATFSSGVFGGIAQGTGVTPTQDGIGGLLTGGLKPADVLRPERSKELEAGVDLGLFHDRGDASLTFYNSKTIDVILPTPLAPSTGYTVQYTNAATFRNRGLEVALNMRPIQRPDFGWEVGLQWARNRGTVLALNGPQYIGFGTGVAQVGQEIGVQRAQGFIRCGITDTTVLAGLAAACAGAPKGALYIDSTGFPLADPNPRILSNPNPRWTGSFRTAFRYRKFQISGLVDVRHGSMVPNDSKGALWSYGTSKDTEHRAICTSTGCVANPNDALSTRTFGRGGFYDGPVAGPGAGLAVPIGQNWYNGGIAPCPFTGIEEPCLENDGYVKLREISITYTLDAAWVQNAIGVSSVDIRISGRNLKTWTKWTGYDPETSGGGATDPIQGSEYFGNPQSRSFVFTITLNR
jgi:TonB-linked SusC/RagA family outer membrane protein